MFAFVQTAATAAGSVLLLGSGLETDWVLLNGSPVSFVEVLGAGLDGQPTHGVIVRVPRKQAVGKALLMVGQDANIAVSYVDVVPWLIQANSRASDVCFAGGRPSVDLRPGEEDPWSRDWTTKAYLVRGPDGDRFSLRSLSHLEEADVLVVGVSARGETSEPWLFSHPPVVQVVELQVGGTLQHFVIRGSCIDPEIRPLEQLLLWGADGESLWRQAPVVGHPRITSCGSR